MFPSPLPPRFRVRVTRGLLGQVALAAVTAGALFFLPDGQPASATPTQPFDVSFDLLLVDPATLNANGTVTRKVTVPSGHHLPFKETITFSGDRGFGPGVDVAVDDTVGNVIVAVDGSSPCDGVAEPPLFANILNKAPGGGEKARWQAIVTPFLVFDFVITEDAGVNTMTTNLFLDSIYCSPLTLDITHLGLSLFGKPVMINPGVEGFETWNASYESAPLAVPAEHTSTDSDAVAIGPDDDGDSVPNIVDNCPAVSNPPPLPGQPQLDFDGDSLGDECDDDIDGDGWLNTIEDFVGTGNFKACAADSTANNEADDGLPSDMDDTGTHTGADLDAIAARIGVASGHPDYQARQDLTADLLLSGADLDKVASVIGTAC